MKSRIRVTAAALSIVAAVAFTAACGDNANDGSTDSPGDPEGTSGGGFAAYLSCLAENGVDMQMPTGAFPSGFPGGAPPSAPPGGAPPSAPPGGAVPSAPPGGALPSAPPGAFPSGMPGGMFQKPAGVDDDTWQKAQAACASVRPSGMPPNG